MAICGACEPRCGIFLSGLPCPCTYCERRIPGSAQLDIARVFAPFTVQLKREVFGTLRAALPAMAIGALEPVRLDTEIKRLHSLCALAYSSRVLPQVVCPNSQAAGSMAGSLGPMYVWLFMDVKFLFLCEALILAKVSLLAQRRLAS